MLYSNMPVRTDTSRSTKIFLCSINREYKTMIVSCTTGMEIRAGINYAHDVIFNKANEPLINNDFGPNVCMLLSTFEKNFSSVNPGFIKILVKHRDSISYKADKGTFKNYPWSCALLKFPLINTLVQVKKIGTSNVQYYFIHGEFLYECDLNTLQSLCNSINIKVPCTINTSEDGILSIKEDEWFEL